MAEFLTEINKFCEALKRAATAYDYFGRDCRRMRPSKPASRKQRIRRRRILKRHENHEHENN